MPVTDQFQRLLCQQILVAPDRQRQLIDASDLEPSIRARGVVNPIIVARQSDGSALLVAGQRRLTASISLGLPDIPVRWVEDLPRSELEIIELEENIKRKDLEWQELVSAVARIHQLYLEQDPDWTMVETATAISLTPGSVSMYIRVAAELPANSEVSSEADPTPALSPVTTRLLASTGIREAYNVLVRRDAREAGDALEELLGVQVFGGRDEGEASGEAKVPAAVAPDLAPVKQLSFLDWAPAYSGPKFNFIHCDFPYGNEVVGPQLLGTESEFYSNSLDTYLDLLTCFCTNLNFFASLSCHLMFWCSSEILIANSEYAKQTWNLFALLAPELEFSKFPLLWVKSDDKGIASDPRRGPRHVYEVCLLASRGGRQIARVVSDAYSAPTDRSLHPSTKPEPMLRHFMTMLVDETSSVLDPTAGSGAALRAADSLGARQVLGLEIDPEHCRVANQVFRNTRLLRSASKAGGQI